MTVTLCTNGVSDIDSYFYRGNSFCSVYGMEAVLLVEVEIPSPRVLSQVELSETEWSQQRLEQLNLIDEKRLKALCHGQAYQQRVARSFNRKSRLKMAQPVNANAPSTAAPAGESMLSNDQSFLLTIIFGTYFGPQLKGERPPHKSAMQRVCERLPQYTPDQLAGSQVMVVQMMHVYYYILRKASKSRVGPVVIAKRFMVIDNIVFIINPSTSYLKEEVVARFKNLTGLQEFVLEKDAAELPIYVTDKSLYEVMVQEAHSGGHGSTLTLLNVGMVLWVCDTSLKAQLDPKVVFSSLSTTEIKYGGAAAASSAKVGVVGNLDVGLRGSINGRVNLAESRDYYLFQVSLQGVRRDQTFSWKLDMSGKVLIEGETATGGKEVESRTGNLCPSGRFSLCFQLPGRVDPRLSHCNFGSDGMFEGVVKKLINDR
ncbi:increased DNA methylation 2-like [Eucalyptus grandis]|uniref:increased DNA methylation 2-like n=1 Tax=Eucalyptus grandis TaxID=71139 RepID=UPI00192EE602|nr:increased DNA methylation 2-like [Eucalyptus grandis]